MDEFACQLLKASMLGSLRQDEAVARQAVMNHQTAAHLMDLCFVRDATEMSIPESYAVQGLSMSQMPREAAALNLADRTPVPKTP
jgi:hypothetical protein